VCKELKKPNASGIVEEREAKREPANVPFYDLAETALRCSLVTRPTADDLVEVYRHRHSVHVHAELKKNAVFKLVQAGKAFAVMRRFRTSITQGLASPKNRMYLAAPAAVPALPAGV
jgi:hypothetical protein